MNSYSKGALSLSALLLATQAMAAQITFYEGEGFRGRAFTTTSKGVEDFQRSGFNDRASSVIVDSGQWQVCQDVHFGGECVLLGPGSYDSLIRLRMNDRISSVRQADTRGHYESYQTPEPVDAPNYDYRRRPRERVYEARITSVHAVLQQQDQHCWVEREQAEDRRSNDRNTGAKVAGALIGGILGHQIGKGGPAITLGGAVAGGVVGSKLAQNHDDREDRGDTYGRDVRHCESSVRGPPDYWDVTYTYGRQEHRVQMDAPPGNTILVNDRGEPRQ
ncbi:MAG: beta/gamma crystallin-related protein [Gammaproteobacteria bacterium]